MNLVVNGRDAMPKGGTITIATMDVIVDELQSQVHGGVSPGRYAVMTVADDGHGMNDETRQHIFEPFFTTKEVGKGSGLGLSIVYGIVKQNGGEVRVDSVEGVGARFTIYLPIELDTRVTPIDARLPEEPAPGPGAGTVLIVEDEDKVRTLVSVILRRQGYTVLESPGADEAARLCREHPEPLQVLLTDVVMPGTSGPELAQRLMLLRPEMRVLYMSGYADSAIARYQLPPGPRWSPQKRP